MIPITLGQACHDCSGTYIGDKDLVITGVVSDTRQIKGGELFAAFDGERVNGATFAKQALELGARAILTNDVSVARATGAPESSLLVVPDVAVALGDLARANIARIREGENSDFCIVGVTGSVGKTTTKDLLAQILSVRGSLIAPPGSFNNEIGLPLTALRADSSTSTLILEMGADQVGNIDYLTSIASPDVAVVLIVARAHVGGFGGIDKVAQAKSEMLDGARQGAPVILNADDERVAAMASKARGPVIFFSSEKEVDVYAVNISDDEAGRASFDLFIDGESHPVTLRLSGKHHVSNALAAASVAHALGISAETIASQLGSAQALSPHRMDVRTVGGVRIIDDSYNANPDSMRAGIVALSRIGAHGRKIAVLGAMLELGEESASEHRALATVLSRSGVDILVCVSDGTQELYSAAQGEGIECHSVLDPQEAYNLLCSMTVDNDTLLLKGSNGSGVWKIADLFFGKD
ncbi:MAG: UDP-N-acetylmuramoyl-tripeptide--D-alanyl-D-alanine ligase [Actinomycetaceae bacterium]|nr:UDP-N-acetylmuramoyl-tripeptide--D-alanyl-D-alanine ligase [Actinomycetaceae bacterium]